MPRSRNRNNGKVLSLKITDFSDRELLAILSRLEDTDGWVDIGDVAEQIWPRTARDPDRAFHARMCVAGRCRYMKSIGLLESGDPGLWKLTALGDEFVRARLRTSQERAILESEPGQELLLAELMGRLYESTDDTAATLIRREFQHRAYQRRWR